MFDFQDLAAVQWEEADIINRYSQNNVAVAEPHTNGYGSTPGRSDWDSILKQVSPGICALTSIIQKQPDEEPPSSLGLTATW